MSKSGFFYDYSNLLTSFMEENLVRKSINNSSFDTHIKSFAKLREVNLIDFTAFFSSPPPLLIYFEVGIRFAYCF